ncbi:MAG: thiamine phosphate synthase [Bacteroidales bacterium]|jgi:thiamine-phosphate pyrophosphorylase|nr:thiamine phosphate synthase [Bacteroidales bacterium]
MRLIVITNETIFEEDGALLNKLFAEGMHTLHIRKPFATEAEVESLLYRIDQRFHKQIVIHDYFNLLNTFSLKGVHLNRRNSFRPNIANISVSRSCHSFQCIETSMNNHNYMFISPIFDSISKAGYNHAFTKEQLLDVKSKHLINEKVMALGGINIKTIPLAFQYGFGGVAVLGSLWENYLQNRNETALLQRFNDLQTVTEKQ